MTEVHCGCWLKNAIAAVIVALLGSATAVDAHAGSFVEQVFSAQPRLLEVYRQRAQDMAKEAGLDPAAVLASPTLRAIEALDHLYRGRTAEAKQMAATLSERRREVGAATFFDISWSYRTVWPYDLQAPWVSAITQGFALALFDGLALATGDAAYEKTAARIARSYELQVSEGGFARWDAGALVFEEFPLPTPNMALRGAAIATLALVDYARNRPDAAASGLAEASGRWWATNTGRYEARWNRYALPVPASALTPVRPHVLIRFVGGGSIDVHRIEVLRDRTMISSLEVGTTGDDNKAAPIYVWSDPAFMNWGSRSGEGGRSFRRITSGQGQYDHAPVSFRLPQRAGQESIALRIHARRTTGMPVQLEAYASTAYVTLGDVPVSTGFTPLDYVLPQTIIEAWEKDAAPLEVDPGGFFENALLVSLIAEAFDNSVIRDYAQWWRSTGDWTPIAYDARSHVDLLVRSGDEPVLKVEERGPESIHVEYPAAIELGGNLHLFYAAFGDDKRWRIMLATSKDRGKTWTKQGQVIDESKLPFKGSYAFPTVVFDPNRREYLLYFSADEDGDGKYDSIWLASSKALWNWQLEGRVVDEGGLDPVVVRDSGGFRLLYTILDGTKSYSVVERTSGDGRVWSGGRAVYHRRDNFSFYTLARLPAARAEFWLVSVRAPTTELHWRLLCRTKRGVLADAVPHPVHASTVERGGWDAYRYGMSFVESGHDTLAFFNGIDFMLGNEAKGQIGLGKIDRTALNALPIDADCN